MCTRRWGRWKTEKNRTSTRNRNTQTRAHSRAKVSDTSRGWVVEGGRERGTKGYTIHRRKKRPQDIGYRYNFRQANARAYLVLSFSLPRFRTFSPDVVLIVLALVRRIKSSPLQLPLLYSTWAWYVCVCVCVRLRFSVSFFLRLAPLFFPLSFGERARALRFGYYSIA